MNRNVDVAVARAFLAVIETGSVTLAARQLNLTQGAISQQLRRLEDLAEHRLFARAGRRIAPPPRGRGWSRPSSSSWPQTSSWSPRSGNPHLQARSSSASPMTSSGATPHRSCGASVRRFRAYGLRSSARIRSSYCGSSRPAPSIWPLRQSLVVARTARPCAATDLSGPEPALALRTHATRCRYRSGRRPVCSDRSQ